MSSIEISKNDIHVFISYAREDEKAAKRLYNDLTNSGLPIKPWIDTVDLLPGHDFDRDIKDLIRKCTFFIPLFSSTSVQKRGYIQREFKRAIATLEEIPPGDIFVIPVRLDDCEILYTELLKYHRQDLFPDWYDGLKKILASLQDSLEKIKQKGYKKNNPFPTKPKDSPPSKEGEEVLQSSLRFIGEKSIFVGRDDYINEKIKNMFKEPGSRVSLVGIGGSGKTQLAFKALRQYYEKDKTIDLVVPIYLSAISSMPTTTTVRNSSITFDNISQSNATTTLIISITKKFLNDIGFYLIKKKILPLSEPTFDQLDIEKSKDELNKVLSSKKHPILYCDSFESLSSTIVEDKERNDQEINSIFNFLNNELPSNTSILITSRNRKNFLSEYPIDLEGLSIEEGIKLFIKHASVYQQHLKDKNNITIQNLLTKIVTKTRGHPLSIEILAKTYKGEGSKELEEISRTLGKERKNPFESEERLRSLHNSIKYSIDKLAHYNKKLLPALTIFHSAFPSNAIEKIFGLQNKDVLRELYDKSFLIRIEADQYGSISDDGFWLYSLHPVLRNYLEDKNKDDIPNIHIERIPFFCKYYKELLEETYNAWGTSDHRNFIRRFELMAKVNDNDFDQAIKFAIINSKEGEPNLRQLGTNVAKYLAHIYTNLGFYDNALTYYTKVLSLREKTDDKLGMASDFADIGRVYRKKGLYDEALVYLNKSLLIYEETNNRIDIAFNYYRLGEVYRYKGFYDEALDYLKKALAIHQELKDKKGTTRDYTQIGAVYRYRGLYDEALEYHKKALTINKELNDRVGMAVNYTRIGYVYYPKGLYDEALDYLKKALEISEDLKDKVGMAENYGAIGHVYRYKGLYDEALDYLKKALAIHQELKDKSKIAFNYTSIGGIYRDKGLYDIALDYNEKALVIDKELNDRVEMAVNFTNIGLAYEKKGLYEEAIAYLKKSLEIDEELNDRVGIAINYSRLGEVHCYKGDYDEALTHHKKAQVMHEKIKNNWWMATNYSRMAVAYHCKGDYDEALTHHKKALVIHKGTNDRVGMAINYFGLGEVYRCKRLYDEALENQENALAIFESLKDKVNLAKIFYSLSVIYKRKNMETESKRAINNVKRIISDFKKETGYNHPFEKNIDSIVEINV